MSEQIEMTLGVALVLDEVVRKVLYAVKEENGQQVIVDRELPFRLRYRLNKDKMMLDKDVEWFNEQKLLLLAQYGEPTDDDKAVEIKDEKKVELFKEAVGRLIDTKISHELVSLEPEDIELVKDPDITVSPEAMTLFIGYLTNDPDLERDLSFDINVTKRASSSVEKKEEPKVETEEVKPVEAPKAEEVKVEEKPKKTTAKKTTTKKVEPKAEKTEAKVTEKKPAAKKTTTKKTTTKKAGK